MAVEAPPEEERLPLVESSATFPDREQALAEQSPTSEPPAKCGCSIQALEQEPQRPNLRRMNAGLTNFWIVDSRVWWRHPVVRIFLPLFIMALDFLVYFEDPVNSSRVEYAFPILGHWYGLLFVWPGEVSMILLRVGIIFVSTLLGMFVGRQWIHHRVLRDRFRLTMFAENKGTLLIMVIFILVFLYFGALAHNFVLGGSRETPISSNTGLEFYQWGKVFQIFSVFLDIVSIVMISDAVFQDRNHYPNWAASFKTVWISSCGGWVRVLATWVIFVVMVTVSTVAILRVGDHPSHLLMFKDGFWLGGMGEVGRTLLLNACVFCDLLAVAQDWEFPSFNTPIDVKVAFTFSDQLSFSGVKQLVQCLVDSCLCCSCPSRLTSWWPSCCCSCSRKDFADFFHFKMTGPWLAYMPLVLAVIFGDLVCGKNQMTYTPSNYGQYVDPRTGRIWNIMDKVYLRQAFTQGVLTSPELITYGARRHADGTPRDASAATDILLNSRYYEQRLVRDFGGVTDVELALWLVGLSLALGFVILVAGGERVWRSKVVEVLGHVAS